MLKADQIEDKYQKYKKSNHKTSFSGKKESSFKRKDKFDILIYNVRTQNAEALEELLKSNDDPQLKINYKYESEMTALHVAASLGNEKIVNLLLDASADINAVNEKGETPLIIAAKKYLNSVKRVTFIPLFKTEQRT